MSVTTVRSMLRSLKVGERVELNHTTDPHTRLRPGDRGTVIAAYTQAGGLDVAWDSGVRLSMLPEEGDSVRAVS